MGWNHQLEAACLFWLAFFGCCVPRRIPLHLEAMDSVVSYSDGEGAKAGLGIAVWSSRCPAGPLAAYCEIPMSIRRRWDRNRGKAAEMTDIFCIEAVGPLAILTTWPNILKNALWVHYIDNVASQYSLVKGSSSINAGDVIVGETWEKVQALGTFAYFDRVESEANPVDGLSRGRREGPWQRVITARLPTDLERLLEVQTSDSDID